MIYSAAQLFQAGVDEQLILDQTGHCSTDGVGVYKWTSSELENQSDILSCSKKPMYDSCSPVPTDSSSTS